MLQVFVICQPYYLESCMNILIYSFLLWSTYYSDFTVTCRISVLAPHLRNTLCKCYCCIDVNMKIRNQKIYSDKEINIHDHKMQTISLDTFHLHVMVNLMEHIFPISDISPAVTCASLFNNRLHTIAIIAGSIFTLLKNTRQCCSTQKAEILEKHTVLMYMLMFLLCSFRTSKRKSDVR